jgi:uncharacterized protein (TIGR00297 family)
VTARLRRSLIGLASAAVVAGIAERRRSLSPSGAIAATLVGTLAFATGWSATRGLLAFFLTSTLLSHLPRRGARTAPRRTAAQVFANGGVASIAWAARLAGGASSLDRLAAASLAVAAADTWATEIGERWGGDPRLITTARRVQPGESGGVTLVGTAAAAAGALLVALAYGHWRGGPLILLEGLIGSIVDSVLGATVQARYICLVCRKCIEKPYHCGERAGLIRGYRWITNDTVNVLATLTGGLLADGIGRRRPSEHPEGTYRTAGTSRTTRAGLPCP